MLNRQKIIYIAWEKHIRSIELSKKFNIDLFFYNYKYSRIIKHPLMIYKTILLISRIRPKILIVQSPSILLSILSIYLIFFFKYKLIIDAHNATVIPDHKILQEQFYFIYKYIHRKSDIVIVTNDVLKEIVNKNGGRAFILPDVLPAKKTRLKNLNLKGKVNVVFICTFGVDEPYLEVIESSRYLPEGVVIYVTGNYKKLKNNFNKLLSDKVILTGFISEEEYWNLLYSAEIIMDLTDRQDCLVAGAYEAVSLSKPLILSDTIALRNYFNRGTIYVDNTSIDIAKAIEEIQEKYNFFKKEINLLKHEIDENWTKYDRDFYSVIKSL